MEFEQDSRLALVLETILKVMLVHQLGHWLSALEGSHSLLEGFHSLNLNDSSRANPVSLDEKGEEIEPGNYVEIIAGDGMAHFDETRDDSESIFVRFVMKHIFCFLYFLVKGSSLRRSTCHHQPNFSSLSERRAMLSLHQVHSILILGGPLVVI